MSVLTKVFVVLVTVLSVLLVALVVPFVANTDNYKAQLATVQQAKQAAIVKADTAQAEITAVQAESANRLADLNRLNGELTTQLNGVNADLARTKAEADTAKADTAKYDANVARLTAASQQFSEIAKAQEAELTQRRADMVDLQTKFIQVSDRNNQMEGQIDTLTRQVRRAQEQVTLLSEQLEHAATAQTQPSTESVAAPSGDGTFEPNKPIQGQVTQVQQHGEDTFVEVNVGSNDGVQPKMRFLVARNGQFLGTLVITAVDTRSAAGTISLKQGDIAAGDAVVTGGY